MGCTAAIVFTCFGASYGTAKSGVGISAMGVLRPDLIVKSTSIWCLNLFSSSWRTMLWHGSWHKCSLYDIITNAHVIDIIPVIMAGIIGIYGLVVSVLVSSGLHQILPLYTGFLQLGAGLSVGLAGLAAGKTPTHQNAPHLGF